MGDLLVEQLFAVPARPVREDLVPRHRGEEQGAEKDDDGDELRRRPPRRAGDDAYVGRRPRQDERAPPCRQSGRKVRVVEIHNADSRCRDHASLCNVFKPVQIYFRGRHFHRQGVPAQPHDARTAHFAGRRCHLAFDADEIAVAVVVYLPTAERRREEVAERHGLRRFVRAAFVSVDPDDGLHQLPVEAGEAAKPGHGDDVARPGGRRGRRIRKMHGSKLDAVALEIQALPSNRLYNAFCDLPVARISGSEAWCGKRVSRRALHNAQSVLSDCGDLMPQMERAAWRIAAVYHYLGVNEVRQRRVRILLFRQRD